MPEEWECKHLGAICRKSDPVYYFYCTDCTQMVKMGDCFNNWLEEFKRLKKELEDVINQPIGR